MDARTVTALALAGASTTLTNLAYVREQAAVASLPALSMRRPLASARLLLSHRGWSLGFAMESAGFGLYAAALALASLALVQSIGAGGIGVLGYMSARLSGNRLGRRQTYGVSLSVLGLLALGMSLSGGNDAGTPGSITGIVAWIGGTGAVALALLAVGRGSGSSAIPQGIAGGLFFSIGDFSTKLATSGGDRVAFVATLIIGYGLGTTLIQIAYQRAGALTVAGLATLMTNAVPIAAGTIVLHEPVPAGVLGVLRVGAFAAVTAGAILIAAPPSRTQRSR